MKTRKGGQGPSRAVVPLMMIIMYLIGMNIYNMLIAIVFALQKMIDLDSMKN
jgi:hypothetical protein